jgi:hypothetical protein
MKAITAGPGVSTTIAPAIAAETSKARSIGGDSLPAMLCDAPT